MEHTQSLSAGSSCPSASSLLPFAVSAFLLPWWLLSLCPVALGQGADRVRGLSVAVSQNVGPGSRDRTAPDCLVVGAGVCSLAPGPWQLGVCAHQNLKAASQLLFPAAAHRREAIPRLPEDLLCPVWAAALECGCLVFVTGLGWHLQQGKPIRSLCSLLLLRILPVPCQKEGKSGSSSWPRRSAACADHSLSSPR